jgi:hypothetical protein
MYKCPLAIVQTAQGPKDAGNSRGNPQCFSMKILAMRPGRPLHLTLTRPALGTRFAGLAADIGYWQSAANSVAARPISTLEPEWPKADFGWLASAGPLPSSSLPFPSADAHAPLRAPPRSLHSLRPVSTIASSPASRVGTLDISQEWDADVNGRSCKLSGIRTMPALDLSKPVGGICLAVKFGPYVTAIRNRRLASFVAKIPRVWRPHMRAWFGAPSATGRVQSREIA